MHLDALHIKVLPQLSYTGNSEHAEGVLKLASIDVGHRHFVVSDGITYEVNFVNTGEAILASGTAYAELDTCCDRCLEPARLNITGEIQGYFLLDPTSIEGGKSQEEYEQVDAKGRVDIAPAVLAAIVYELPTISLCTPDCDGIITPVSDTSGNESSQYDGEREEAINPLSPFAALKDYKCNPEEQE